MLTLALIPALASILMFVATVKLQPRRSAAKLQVRLPAEVSRGPSVTPLPRPSRPSRPPEPSRRAA